MSEYQYYEFLAIDRPLTAEETSVLRSISTRARITPVSFTNVYNFGSFSGDPDKMMAHYFDAHVYVANWMTAIFMVRLPIEALSKETAKAMATPYTLEFKATKNHWIITWRLEESENYHRFGMESGEGWMARLAPIREELLCGDLRSLYIGWIAAVSRGTMDDELTEPMSIDGLGELTPAQQALAQFIEADPDLLTGSGMDRPGRKRPELTRKIMDQWIDTLPAKEAHNFLRQVLEGKGHKVQRDLKTKFNAWQKSLLSERDQMPLRSIDQLFINAEKARNLRIEKEKQTQREKEIKRQKERKAYLKNLSKNFQKTWKMAETTVLRGSGLAYDEVCTAIVDISQAHAMTGTPDQFTKELNKFLSSNMQRKALIQRLIKAGVYKSHP